MLNAIEKAYEEVNTNVLTSDFGETTIADRAADFMSRQGYRTVLAGTGRFAAELLSNIGMAMFVDQKAFADGLNYQDMIFSDVGAIVMNVLGSTQKDRVYAEGLAGRFVDPNVVNRADNSAGSRINSDIQIARIIIVQVVRLKKSPNNDDASPAVTIVTAVCMVNMVAKFNAK